MFMNFLFYQYTVQPELQLIQLIFSLSQSQLIIIIRLTVTEWQNASA